MSDTKPKPSTKNGVPYCTEDSCPLFDGKRCSALGHRPGNICEPVVADVTRERDEWKAKFMGVTAFSAENGSAFPSELLAIALSERDAEKARADALQAKVDDLISESIANAHLRGRLQAKVEALENREPEWVVNSLGELGVKVSERCFFLYKADNIEYGASTHEEDGDGWKTGEPLMYRPVFKREFGECAHPINYADPTRIGTVSRGDSDEWKPLPPRPKESLATAPATVEPDAISRLIADAMKKSKPLVADAVRAGRAMTRSPGLIGSGTPEPKPDTSTPHERALSEALRNLTNATESTLRDHAEATKCCFMTRKYANEARAALGPNPPRYYSREEVERIARAYQGRWTRGLSLDRIIDEETKP